MRVLPQPPFLPYGATGLELLRDLAS